MTKALMILVPLLTLFTLKPFINGLGCKFKYLNESPIIMHEIYCKNGILVSDFFNKKSKVRTIRKSLYGYWGGFAYNIPIYQVRHSEAGHDAMPVSAITKYELYSIWSVYPNQSIHDNKTYTFLDSDDGTLLESNFIYKPSHGFIE